jgi:hypothetical protein
MSNQGTFITLELAPGAVRPVIGEARNFHVLYSPVDIEIKYPGGEFCAFPQGTGLAQFPNAQTFPRLEVRNPSVGTATVVLWLGGPVLTDSRSALIEPDTLPLAWEGDELAAGNGVSFNGIPTGRRIRRKAILVTNLDANLRLQFRDAGGRVIASVFPEQTYSLPISKAVEVYNPNGSALACNIAEIWWTL